jgi:SAM-dependent methyltransferase
LYDEWAATYEQDTADSMGYVGHEVAAARLSELIAAGARVLDAGCGTGLVGTALAERGDYVIDGLDVSPGMLEKARAAGVYRELRTADLTVPLDIADDAYAAVVCVGTLTEGHVGPEALAELVRVTRPEGVVVATVLESIWEPKGYRSAVDSLVAAGSARLVEADEHPYRTHQGATCRLVVLKAR